MKNVKYTVTMKLIAGKAEPKPPISTILGPSNINITKFCDDFNNWSKDFRGEVEFGVLIYDDLSYSILTKEQFKEYSNNQINKSLSFMYNDENISKVKNR